MSTDPTSAFREWQQATAAATVKTALGRAEINRILALDTPSRQPITEHPVRCPARLSFSVLASDHTHECIHPAKRPEGVVGVLEHACHCGATWSERSSADGTTTSNEEQP